MYRVFLILSILISGIFLTQFSADRAYSAQLTPEIAKEHNISFPIPDLGSCNNCNECNDFCSNPINKEKCIAFSKKTGLFDEEQKQKSAIYEKAKTDLGCNSEESCRSYCQQEANFDKCKLFAVKNDIIDQPAIVNLAPGAIVSKTQSIALKAPKSSKIDVQLQPLDSVTDTLYVGRIGFKGDITTEDFSWDSTNTPNGEYNLIATVYDGDQAVSTIGPIRVKVNNIAPPGAPEITTKDIVLPSQFKPENISVDSSTTINKVENTKTETNQTGVVMQGKALPNTIVTVFIYSNPIVVTVRTDANGLWKYTLEKPLDSGKHIAYVVTSRTDGTKVRSEASSFLIPPALAAGKNESLSLESANDESGPLQTFIYVTIGIIAAAAGGVIIIYRIKSRNASQ